MLTPNPLPKRTHGMEARVQLILAMAIFGTIGVFRRYILLPSGVVALSRAVIGMLFLMMVLCIKRQKLDIGAIRRNIGYLIASGAFLGFNWMLLFEAYRYTSVATATLCYYMAPIMVVTLSPLLLGERLTRKKLLCAAVAMGGMVMVTLSSRQEMEEETFHHSTGILLGLGAAVFYAGIMIFNKKMSPIAAYDKTVIQLGVSAAVLLLYVLFVEQWYAPVTPDMWSGQTVLFLFLVSVVHTGVAYTLYFGSIGVLPAQTVALFSYIDPILAVFLSAVLLGEPMSVLGYVGTLLVFGATVVVR